jgi:hypothetical protein
LEDFPSRTVEFDGDTAICASIALREEKVDFSKSASNPQISKGHFFVEGEHGVIGGLDKSPNC